MIAVAKIHVSCEQKKVTPPFETPVTAVRLVARAGGQRTIIWQDRTDRASGSCLFVSSVLVAGCSC
jgi:hypothetical protein